MEQLKFKRLERLVIEIEDYLRAKAKYSEKDETTWTEVLDWYYELRNEYLLIDLLAEDL